MAEIKPAPEYLPELPQSAQQLQAGMELQKILDIVPILNGRIRFLETQLKAVALAAGVSIDTLAP